MPEEKVSRADYNKFGTIGSPPAADAGPRQHDHYCSWNDQHDICKCQICGIVKLIGHPWPAAALPVPQEAAPAEHRPSRYDALPATALDEAMRVAQEIGKMLTDGVRTDVVLFGDNDAEHVAALIRQAGSHEIAKLRADYDREHKWLNDAASEANSDLDSVASVIRKLRQAGSERERELREALSAAIPFLFEHGSHQNNNCYRGSDDGCYCGLDEAKKLIKLAEASRLLGGES